MVKTTLNQVIDNLVEPLEFVNAFGFFGAGPAGLDADMAHSEFSDLVIGFFRIENSPIQFFKPESPDRVAGLPAETGGTSPIFL